MERLSLEDIKVVQLDILKNLDEFCKASNIHYFLCNGSLLGAVKYKGYIPWDDDIDVCLLRKDYDRLIQEYSDPEGRYVLLSLNKTEGFLFPFAKLSDQRTMMVENISVQSTYGVNIDVFPIDCYGDSLEAVQNISVYMNNLRKCLNWSKLKNYKSNSIVKSILKWMYSLPYKVIGGKYYCRKMIARATKKQNGTYYGNVVWGFYGAGEAFDKKLFTEQTTVTFEGGQYPAPKDYDQYLSGLYGKWREDPPLEKQKSHHVFSAYLKDDDAGHIYNGG